MVVYLHKTLLCQFKKAFLLGAFELRCDGKFTLVYIFAVRAGLLTTAGLLAGTLLGSALQSWLRVDIVPIGVSPLCVNRSASMPYVKMMHCYMRQWCCLSSNRLHYNFKGN